MKKHTILLSIILLFSLFMRLYLIEDIPPGIFVDEVVSAYEAYSIMHTMHDTYGVYMPLLFRATDDYRDCVHIYSLIPFISVFGLSVLAVRLSTVFYGTLAILFTYLYVEKAFDRRTALLSALLLSISPWNYIFSRIAFQAITYPAFLLLALYLFHKWLSGSDKRYLVYSAVVFGISTYTYFPSRLWTPVFILGLFLAYFKRIIKRKREIVVPVVVFLLFFSPHVYFLAFSPEKQTSRFDSTSIFNERVKKESIRKMQSIPLLSNMTDNDFAVYSYKFFENYRQHVSYDFLFSSGDGNLRHSVKGFGKLHPFQFPLIVLGIIICLLRRGGKEVFLLWWLVTYPIAVSLTSESLPHSIRAISAMPLFEILSAYAIVSLYGFCAGKSRRWYSRAFRKLMLLPLLTLLAYGAFNAYSFFDAYFNAYPKEAYNHFDLVGDAVEYAGTIDGNYDKIFVTHVVSYYDYKMAFFRKLDPKVFQEKNRKFFDPSGKYAVVYPRPYCERYANDERILFVLRKEDRFLELSDETFVYNPDGTPAYLIGSRCMLSESPYIQKWLLCGPFPNELDEGIDSGNYWNTSIDNGLFTDYIGERTIAPKKGGECGGKEWIEYGRADDPYMDLDRIFRPNDEVVSYAHVYVYSPTEQDAVLWYGSDDGISIWLNNMPVKVDHRHRSAVPDGEAARLYLKAGWNSLLLKIEDVTGNWGFYARITDPDNNEMEGVRYSTSIQNP